ncbi:MAG: hypothetical protein QW134_01015 [Nitrososphaeria archaeon]
MTAIKIVFLDEKSFLLKLPKDIPNKFITTEIETIPFAYFDTKLQGYRVPIYELPKLIKILRLNEKDIPVDVLSAFRNYYEEEKRSIFLYYDFDIDEVKGYIKQGAVDDVKKMFAKYFNRDKAFKNLKQYSVMIEEAKVKNINVVVSKDIDRILSKEGFAFLVAKKITRYFPNYPAVKSDVVDVGYVEDYAKCELCNRATQKVFYIKTALDTIIPVCPLCASLVLERRVFKRNIYRLKKKTAQKKAKLGLFFVKFYNIWSKIRLFLAIKGRLGGKKEIASIRQMVESLVEKEKETISKEGNAPK